MFNGLFILRSLFLHCCCCRYSGPWQCILFLIPRSFHDGGALNYSTAPHRSKTTLISYGVFCLLESKILSIGQTLLYSLAVTEILNVCFVNVEFFESKKLRVKRASHFVKIIVACPHCLPKLPKLTQRKQAIPNKGSLFYSHCALEPAAKIQLEIIS
jgi:hypothetical protein